MKKVDYMSVAEKVIDQIQRGAVHLPKMGDAGGSLKAKIIT